jgi:hypothetical protein
MAHTTPSCAFPIFKNKMGKERITGLMLIVRWLLLTLPLKSVLGISGEVRMGMLWPVRLNAELIDRLGVLFS